MNRTLQTIALPAIVGLAVLAPRAAAQDFDDPLVTITAGTVAPRAKVTIRWSITNWDNKTIAACRHGIYISTDRTITTADTLIQTVETPQMGKMQIIREFEWTVPEDVPRGTFYIGGISDHLRQVNESNEGNNVTTDPKSYPFYGAPDLTVAYRIPSETRFARGGTYTVTAPVQNLGGYPSTPTYLEVMVSLNNTLGASDPVLAKVAVPALLARQTVNVQARITIPVDFPIGSYYLGYWVNRAQDARGESELRNNTRVYGVRYYQEGSFWTFGGGCRGRSGLVPGIQPSSTGGDPHVGGSVAYVMSRGQRDVAVLVGLGLSRHTWNGLLLPRDMGAFGAPGCVLYTSLDLLVGVRTDSGGQASLSLGLPSSVPVGTKYYTQFFSADPVNSLGLVFSPVVETTVGSTR
ncbi:MAG: hypothetical protein H6837_01930 [Planctomycetes bacterium]|nr:hypothetical protein [Planctomycetota bacterium]